MNPHPASFLHLCNRLQEIENQRESVAKTDLLSNYLSEIRTAEDLTLAVQFPGEGPFPTMSGKRISAGSRTLGLAASAFCDIDYDLVFKPSRAATGSHSETIERLMENIPEARKKRKSANLSLVRVQQMFNELLMARSRKEKTDLLHSAWAVMTPLEIAFFIRIMKGQSPLAGLRMSHIITAIAKAFQTDPAKTEYAHMMTSSLGEAAILARENRLCSASFRLFQPVSVMHAERIKNTASVDVTAYTAEEKLEGLRAQIHIHEKNVEIFDRDGNRITQSFPDVADALNNRQLPPTVFDGVISLVKDDRIQPLQLLLNRMQSKKLSPKVLADSPVLFIAFDLLYADQIPLFRTPLRERRTMLSRICEKFSIPMTLQFNMSAEDDLQFLLKRSISRGNEGIILKKRNSMYEFGKRNRSWLNLKKPDFTLDTVVMYARSESRKRGELYSDFTLGVSVEKDSRYEEDFIPIGKIDSGYSSGDLQQINAKIQELIVERYGPTLGLKPGLIIRTAFRRIQKNNRTKAGYALDSPYFKKILPDSQSADAHTLADVEELYQRQVSQTRSLQAESPAFIVNGFFNIMK